MAAKFERAEAEADDEVVRADANLGDLFGNLFGGATAGTSRRSTRGPRRGADIEGEVTLDFADALSGATVSMRTTSEAACPTCHGTGARPGTQPRVCPVCQGSGMQTSAAGGVFAVSEPCRECRGRGMVVDDPCPTCQGSGRGESTRTMQVRIPAGVTDGQRIRIKGRGQPGRGGAPDGDLFVLVHVTPDRLFGRSESNTDNLTLSVPVSYPELALGTTLTVPTLDGSVSLKVPAGTSSGRTFRVRGRGVPKANGPSGDLLVTVQVAVPKELDEEAASALRAYADATKSFDPRAGLF